ncbi:hypothetical protein GL218_00847 [Daldinia childiae]|uniref:uncharacterized protein n=1 Tax=Daldinia childiae TaxID=326645 RepID=UPI001448794B|nr:uncharacterized protein GL218_00847 [Daldinia childiae]KAF3070437.1 hypothetical protein GL218_00847 [Daldinia childiae]
MTDTDMKIDPQRAAALVSQIKTVRERIAAVANGRDVRLVAVSKLKPANDILALLEQASPPQLHFGENYAQELSQKAELLPRSIQWHFIGGLQSGHCKSLAKIPNLFSVSSIDTEKKAQLLDKYRGEYLSSLSSPSPSPPTNPPPRQNQHPHPSQHLQRTQQIRLHPRRLHPLSLPRRRRPPEPASARADDHRRHRPQRRHDSRDRKRRLPVPARAARPGRRRAGLGARGPGAEHGYERGLRRGYCRGEQRGACWEHVVWRAGAEERG